MHSATPRRAAVAALLLASGGCGPAVTHRVQSGSIRHLPAGHRLIHVRPGVAPFGARLTFGGSVPLVREPAVGAFDSPLYTDDALWGTLEFVWPSVGLGLVAGRSIGTPARGPGETPGPPKLADGQSGLRFRVDSPGDRFFVTGMLELGVRMYHYREHIVETCNRDTSGEYFCHSSDRWSEPEHGHGGTSSDPEGYLTTSVLPVFRIGDGSYAYAGIGWDNFTTGWEMADVGHPGADYQERYTYQDVFPVYLGLDVGLTSSVSGLISVQLPVGSEGTAVPVVDGGLSVDF